jgi:hypothetical protein
MIDRGNVRLLSELEPSFPYREVNFRRNVDMKEFYDLEVEVGRYIILLVV